MNLLITICARGGSKGIPRKNIKDLNGKPLIAYTIDSARLFAEKNGADIALSTDCSEIQDVASNHNLMTSYIRPKQLANDTAGKIEVIKDLLEFEERVNQKEYDFILDLDVTSPLRTQEDLDQAYNKLISCKDAHNIFSVNRSNRNPYFNMVEQDSDGYVRLVKEGKNIKSRQSAPFVFDMNASFYFYRRSFFRNGFDSSITSKSLPFIMNHICFDLDNPDDFVLMDLMMRQNLIDFKF